MEWMQFFGFILTIAGMFFWNRTEGNADRREIATILREMKEENKQFREKWADETKEFHGRLCAIEERSRK